MLPESVIRFSSRLAQCLFGGIIIFALSGLVAYAVQIGGLDATEGLAAFVAPLSFSPAMEYGTFLLILCGVLLLSVGLLWLSVIAHQKYVKGKSTGSSTMRTFGVTTASICALAVAQYVHTSIAGIGAYNPHAKYSSTYLTILGVCALICAFAPTRSSLVIRKRKP